MIATTKTALKNIGIVGGETHLYEVTSLIGSRFNLQALTVPEKIRNRYFEEFEGKNYNNIDDLLENESLDIIAISNENDLRFETIVKSFNKDIDLIVDKPLCLTLDEQIHLEQLFKSNPGRRILNLLTLRSAQPWMFLKQLLEDKSIGEISFMHIRMAVQLKKDLRPEWFLNVNRSGGLFLDLLTHGLDQVEWLSALQIVNLTAVMGNIGYKNEFNLRNHASVYCELNNGGSAIVEGQRMLPDIKSSDYRVLVAGTDGTIDMIQSPPQIIMTNKNGKDQTFSEFPEPVSIVENWLCQGNIISQKESLRSNRLAVLATLSAQQKQRMEVL